MNCSVRPTRPSIWLSMRARGRFVRDGEKNHEKRSITVLLPLRWPSEQTGICRRQRSYVQEDPSEVL